MTSRTPTATEVSDRPLVVRNNRATRWLHAALYLVSFVLLGTGWWLFSGREGQPSLLADALDSPDAELHRTAGWALVVVVGVGVVLGIRGAVTFVRETLRVDRGDAAWFWHWPRGMVTGRFGHHSGHFDPGQRLANVAFVVVIGTLIASGVALTTLSGGGTFAIMVRVHRAATYALTALVAGHLLVASGVLPGYRGAWRAMHWRGRVPHTTARRLWPASAADAGAEPDERVG
jgi:formate dehydrogenase subunit gamma